jgi:rhamnulokinase
MTQLMDAHKWEWAGEIFNALKLPLEIMPPINPPGTALGPILADIAEETGIGDAKVVAVASHDTGSAASAVPGKGDFAFISSGTWSVPGTFLDAPVTTPEVQDAGFANEWAFASLFVAKNILGLWPVQELKRQWDAEGSSLDYGRLTEEARNARGFLACIDINDERFLAPADMEAEIRGYLDETHQALPETKGETVRLVLESLAFSYRRTFDRMRDILKKRIEAVHIVGGGIQNTLLCQFTANACGLPVVAGPIEATASGNILVQAHATGEIGDAADIRTVVANSFELTTYEPEEEDAWQERYRHYLAVIGES